MYYVKKGDEVVISKKDSESWKDDSRIVGLKDPWPEKFNEKLWME